MFSNTAHTSPDHPEAALRDRRYRCSVQDFIEAVRTAVGNLKRWRLVSSDVDQGVVHLEHDTPLVRFTDDVHLKLMAIDGDLLVSAGSASRVGEWDFGVNRKNLREILSELDRLLPSSPATT